MNKLIVVLFFLLLFGCTTRQVQFVAPELSNTAPLKIKNVQDPGEFRTVMTDGITSFKGSYYQLNDRLIAKVQQSAIDNGIASDEPLTLRLLAVRCGGSFLGDCEMSVEVNYKGKNVLISSDKRNGYPWQSALEKALDEVAEKVILRTLATTS